MKFLNLKYQLCWIFSQWTDHRFGLIESCVEDGYNFWEEYLNPHNNENVIDEDCNSINGIDLFSENVDSNKLFQQLSYNRKKPLQIRKGLSLLTNFNFSLSNLEKYLQQNNSSLSNGWVVFDIEPTGIQRIENVTLSQFVEFEKRSQFGARLALLDIEKVWPEFVLKLLNNKILFDAVDHGLTKEDVKTSFLIGHGIPRKENSRLFHADVFENINFQLEGTKKWTLVDSKFLFQFRPYVNGPNIGSPFNLVGENKPKNWNLIPKMHCIMEPGDIMYVPTSYLHKVDYPYIGKNQFSTSMLFMWADFKRFMSNSWESAAAVLDSEFLMTKLNVFTF